VTGFMRTTHFTGTVTDVGLLIGQIYPNNVKNPAHHWKLQILAGLIVVWIAAGAVGAGLYELMGNAFAFIAGALGLGCGIVGEVYLRIEERDIAKEKARVAAEEAQAAAETAAVEAQARSESAKQKLRRASKTVVRRMAHGLEALQEIAKDMDGNLESMPSPAVKNFHLAYNTKRASSKFLMKLKSRAEPATDADISDEAVQKANRKLGSICEFLLSKPELVDQLENDFGEKGGGDSSTSFADFLASFSLAQMNYLEAAAAEAEAGPKGAPKLAALFPAK